MPYRTEDVPYWKQWLPINDAQTTLGSGYHPLFIKKYKSEDVPIDNIECPIKDAQAVRFVPSNIMPHKTEDVLNENNHWYQTTP